MGGKTTSFEYYLQAFSEQDDIKETNRSPIELPEIDETTPDQERRRAFRQALKVLSSLEVSDALDEVSLQCSISFFSILYCDSRPYRHLYSDICDVMYSFLGTKTELDNGVPPEAKWLANNLEMIEQAAKAVLKEETRALKCISKLHDHVELENTRMKYMAKQNDVNTKNAAKLRKEISGFETKINDTQEKLQRNYVTILGIFAAIVIAFAAGTTFTSSVLQAMASVSVYRLVFVICLLALVLFNLVFSLFFFICRVSRFEEGKYLPRLIFWSNIILLLCIVLTCLAWFWHLP